MTTTEYGIFTAEGCIERGFYRLSEAAITAGNYDPDDNTLVAAMCDCQAACECRQGHCECGQQATSVGYQPVEQRGGCPECGYQRPTGSASPASHVRHLSKRNHQWTTTTKENDRG